MALDLALGFVVGHRHRAPRHRRFGMRVPDKRAKSVGQPLFDRPVQPPARRPVGIHQRLFPERRSECLVYADDVAPERLEVRLQLTFFGLGKTVHKHWYFHPLNILRTPNPAQ
jgi:hypothetical protein